MIGWLFAVGLFLCFVSEASIQGAWVLAALWSAGFAMGYFVHRRTHEGMREEPERRIRTEPDQRAMLSEALQRERQRLADFKGNYDDYLRDRAAEILTEEEFQSECLTHHFKNA